MKTPSFNEFNFGFRKIKSTPINYIVSTINDVIVDYDHWMSVYIQQYFADQTDLKIYSISVTDSEGGFPSIYAWGLSVSILYSYKGELNTIVFQLRDLDWINENQEDNSNWLNEDVFDVLNSQLHEIQLR